MTIFNIYAILKLWGENRYGIDILNRKILPNFDVCAEPNNGYTEFLDSKMFAIDTLVPLKNVINQFNLPKTRE